jgi:hypothetical protein
MEKKITFNKVKEAVEAAGVPVNNFNSTGEIATKILNDFEKIDKNDFLEALAIVSTVEAGEAAKAREEEILREAEAKAAEEERNSWRNVLLSLNERQKTVALYIKGVLQYTRNDGIRIIGKAIIDSIVNDDNTFQIAVRLTKALDKSQNLEVADRQWYDAEIGDFLYDIMDIIEKNNEDVIIGKINKSFATYMEVSPAEPYFSLFK